MKIDEVHFNHDTSSATSDAFNIRQNASGSAIVAPEWKDGNPSQPVAYARFELGPAVTIKARITGASPNASIKIRAIDPWVPPADPGGCLGWLVVLIAKLVRSLFGNVLGEVEEKTVTFDAAGDSGVQSFNLIKHKLAVSHVGKRQTTWTWQAYTGGSWTDIGTTEHTVYIVLEIPKTPWQQSGVAGNNIQLPWVDALEKACYWGFGADTLDKAAAAITLGINRVPNVSYTPATMFGSTNYNLTGYLNALDSSSDFIMNCRDCANAVTTFANLLGTNLYEGRFDNLDTRKFLTLSGDPSVPADWVEWMWGWHEIAWTTDTMDENGLVYDGCLQLDIDNNYADSVHVAHLPVKMVFGTTTDGSGYRYRLIENGTGSPHPPTKQRPVV